MKDEHQSVHIPHEYIVVEGRDDTTRLIETYGPSIKTIETNGSAINQETLDLIKHAQEKFGVIVLTDPDFQGERIRHIIQEFVPQALHAYLSRAESVGRKQGQSLGLEHAHPASIRKAIEAVSQRQANQGHLEMIPLSTLISLKLVGHPQAQVRRDYLSEYYRIGHMNGKQMQKKLAIYQISIEELVRVIQEGESHGKF